jgi:ParB-like chromosome segregation protein Spo0J
MMLWDMTTILANQILSLLGKPEEAQLPEAAALTTHDKPAKDSRVETIIRLPLTALRIDRHQPRNYLPHDLRAELVHHGDVQKTLQSLITRAASNDVVAAGYLDSIRTLARSIADVGLQQPIRVSADKAGTYRIVDGERRFWAHIFLRETAGGARYETINAIVHDARASGDDVQRAQWAANLCREDIPAVDFAETIWQIREQFLLKLVQDRKRYAAELGIDDAGMTTAEMALALTQREVARLTGRAFSDRHLYTHLAIAERLKPQAKALARAYGIGVRPLSGIVRLPEPEQVRLIKQMAGIDEPKTAQDKDATAPRTGRPTSLQRGINACIGLKEALHKLTENNLSRQTPADVRALLAELDSAAAQIEHARQMARDHLPASDEE